MRLLTDAAILGLGVGIVVAVAWACESPTKIALTDTEGRRFKATCRSKEACQIGQSDDDPASMTLGRSGRVVSVCPRAGTLEAWQCRPLICEADADCPPAIGLDHGACVSGLCIEPSQDVAVDDAIVLCLAGTGLGKDSRLQIERFAMALQCGSPCTVPKPCRQL